MPQPPAEGRKAAVMGREGLDALLASLRRRGFTVVGPAHRDGAIVFEELASNQGIPAGWTAEQAAGSYRAVKGDGSSLFAWAVGPDSPKRFFHPPQLNLWRARRRKEEFEFVDEPAHSGRLALVGIRPCEIAAIRVQDRVFLQGPFADPGYRARRESAFIVTAQCTRPGGACFCASLGTGPGAEDGFDLSVTEVPGGDPSALVVEAGSAAGEEVLEEAGGRPAAPAEIEAARWAVREAAGHMGRAIEMQGLKDILYRSLEHPRWDNVAERCLACGNCTSVCPTCFCTTVEDVTDLAGENAERHRKWDSCFSMDFSYVFGGHIRRTHRARYRQWLTHKLATWQDQFGTPGCVGCGRCIVWCPAGIDITEEARAIREGA